MTPRARSLYPHIVSTLALVVALGSGGAFAAGLAKNSVGSKQIKNGAVKMVDLKPGALTGAAVADGSVTGADILESSLSTVPSAATAATAATVDGLRRVVTPTIAPTTTLPLAVRGPLSLALYCDTGPVSAMLQLSTSTDNGAYASDNATEDDFDVSDGPRAMTFATENVGQNLWPVHFTAKAADGASMTVLGWVYARPGGCSADIYILG